MRAPPHGVELGPVAELHSLLRNVRVLTKIPGARPSSSRPANRAIADEGGSTRGQARVHDQVTDVFARTRDPRGPCRRAGTRRRRPGLVDEIASDENVVEKRAKVRLAAGGDDGAAGAGGARRRSRVRGASRPDSKPGARPVARRSLEAEDLPDLAVLLDDEIVFGQPAERLAVFVEDHGVYSDEVDRRREPRRFLPEHRRLAGKARDEEQAQCPRAAPTLRTHRLPVCHKPRPTAATVAPLRGRSTRGHFVGGLLAAHSMGRHALRPKRTA